MVSGYDSSVVETSDPAVLLRALERPVSADEIAAIAPFRFRAPLSPDIAAAREGRSIDFDELVEFSRDAVAANNGLMFIEGVGGIMVPLDAERTVLDWMAALGLPVILVVGGYLGTISHTLTALDVLTKRGLRIAAIVVSEKDNDTVPLDDTVASIARFSRRRRCRRPAAPARRHHPAPGRSRRIIRARVLLMSRPSLSPGMTSYRADRSASRSCPRN